MSDNPLLEQRGFVTQASSLVLPSKDTVRITVPQGKYQTEPRRKLGVAIDGRAPS
ncbi:MAG TPA: hypothetical protein VFQ24_01575 [Terriglobia bacterium]|nr:hypothetical protein [Terriglobia bacterium]